MSKIIKIGHASGTEFRTASGGTPGDQRGGKEVCIVNKFTIGKDLEPTVVLRPVNSQIAEKSAAACEAGCNNNNIGYDQSGRNTLLLEAFKTNLDLSKITASNACETDCTAFVSTCAIVGGAHIDYKYSSQKFPNLDTVRSLPNLPYSGDIRRRLSKYGDYIVLTSDTYLKQTDYLRRGDILVAEPGYGRKRVHAVMVLGNGSNQSDAPPVTQAPETSSTSNSNISTSSRLLIKLDANISSIKSSKVDVVSKALKIKNGVQEPLNDTELLGRYSWEYKVTPLSNKSENTILKKLSVTSDVTKFSIENLKPNSTYFLQVTATKRSGTDTFSSQNIIFETKSLKPSLIEKLAVEFAETDELDKKCTISFEAPDSWGDSVSGFEKGYRVSLIVNGKIVAYNDSILKPYSAKINKSISLADISKKYIISYNDILQIGIQAWLRDTKNNFIFDSDAPTCSQPIYVKPALTTVNKAFIKTQNNFKQVILYSK